MRIAREKLDFSRPVAIMLMGILGHIGNAEEDRVAQSIVGTLGAALPVSGYLAIYDTSDANPGQNDALRKYNESGADPYRVRRPDQIARFFDGPELTGLCPIPMRRTLYGLNGVPAADGPPPPHTPRPHVRHIRQPGSLSRLGVLFLANSAVNNTPNRLRPGPPGVCYAPPDAAG